MTDDTTSPIGEPPFPPVPATPRRIGAFTILGLLGEGGMGRVYLALEDTPPREVALKVMRGVSAEGLARFRREMELLARLEHPHIARLYGAGTALVGDAELPWLALEYVRGPDLERWVWQQRPTIEVRLRMLIDICRAVEYAHARDVIHRDLKPSNILVAADGHPKVLDFGIARLARDDAGMTATGQLLGTIPYMSPEQMSGRHVDARSDVYALGAISYQLLSGRLPHPRLSTATLFEALELVRREEPPRLAHVQPGTHVDLDNVVMKALASEPERRYATAGALADDLERALKHRPVSARAPTLGYRLSRFVRRNRALTVAAVAIAASLVAATAVSLRYAWSEAVARRVAEERANEAAAVSGFLERMLTSADPDQSLGRDLRVTEVLDQAASGLTRERLPDETRARLLRTLGRTYLNLGAVDSAHATLGAARARLPASEAGSVLGAQIALDAVATDIARNEHEAARRALDALLAGKLDAERRVAARLLLTQVLAAQGELPEAERLLRSLVEEAGRVLGPDDVQTLTARHNLSVVLQQRGELEEAMEIAEAVLERRTAVFGPDHPETLYSLNNLAAVYQVAGRAADAEKAMRRAIQARTRVLGAKHPSTLTTKRNLAIVLLQSGRPEEGAKLAASLVEDWVELRGETAPQTMSARHVLAYAYEDLGRLDEAEAALRAIVATQVAAGGPSDPSLVSPRNDLAMLLMKRGNPAAALAEFDGLLPWAERLLGADNAVVAIYVGNRGECLARLGRLEEARAVLEASHARLIAAFGAGHARTRTAAERLAAVYTRLGLTGKAKALTNASTDRP
jgi:eukaryotic-like serine/threonine-protein kinase